MPLVTVQMTIFMQKPKSSPVNALNGAFSMNLLMHRMKLITALMMKWAVRASRSGVWSVKVKRIEPTMELTYIHTKKRSKAMTRKSGMNAELSVEMLKEKLVKASPRKTIERRGGISDALDGGLASGAMVAL